MRNTPPPPPRLYLYLPLSLFASLPHIPVCLSLFLLYTQTGCGAEKDIRNVTSKGWMALTDTSAQRKSVVKKKRTQTKITVLISMTDCGVASVWLPGHDRGGTIRRHEAKRVGNYRLPRQEIKPKVPTSSPVHSTSLRDSFPSYLYSSFLPCFDPWVSAVRPLPPFSFFPFAFPIPAIHMAL